MRSEDRHLWVVRPVEEGVVLPDAPLDTDVVALHAELVAAGRQAGRSLHGRTQPTRYYSTQLRARLLDRFKAAT